MERYPSPELAKRMMQAMRSVIFPEYFHDTEAAASLQEILPMLLTTEQSGAIVEKVSALREALIGDAMAMAHNDPAVTDLAEVIICYPFMTAIIHYRVAHELLLMGVPMLPRLITEIAHSSTGIDIHPAATIGKNFCIDHGTGVVIGATTIIGDNVMLYQGVTLGAKNFKYDDEGHPLNEPRHPILEDNVTVYSNTSILGKVRIGKGTIVGGNIWLTHDVPPGSKIIQGKATSLPSFMDGAGI
jgi:Serine acetyltransferase